MSETFYIKKTAFDDNNFDLVVRETDSFIIGPGELNGPGGNARDSDLELYGFGSLKWGEGVDQNQYRQLESSACPAKIDGDFLAGGADGNTAFLVGTHGIVPKSEEDLGIGNGITKPLIGQLWYNNDDKILYNYELTGWETVFKEATTTLDAHASDIDLHLGSPQNIFLDGLILTGSPVLTSTDVNQLIGFRELDGTVQGQLDLMVEKAGDIMTGNLTIDTTNPSLILQSEATNEEPQFTIHDNTGIERANFRYTDGSGVGDDGDVSIIRRNSIGIPETTLTLEADGNVKVNAAAPQQPDQLTNKNYVDTKEWDSVNIADGSITAAKIATGAVTNTKLGSFSVTTAKINGNAVTEAKIAPNSVRFGDQMKNSSPTSHTLVVASFTTSAVFTQRGVLSFSAVPGNADALHVQIYTGGNGWVPIRFGIQHNYAQQVISDGTNVRINNATASNHTVYWEKTYD